MKETLQNEPKERHGTAQSPRDLLRYYFSGLAMGSADIVPGVSGGTMAFILGIYEDLLAGIKSFDFRALQLLFQRRFSALLKKIPLFFLSSLALGILSAILLFSSLLSYLLREETLYTFSFFGGLILASTLVIGANFRWTPKLSLVFLLSALFAFALLGIRPLEGADHSLPSLFLSGMIAICAMILPGISGSFILLLLGQYEFILEAVHTRNLLPILVVGAGCAVGIVLFARFLSYLLKHYHALTISALTGFMLGSLRVIWAKASSGLPQFSSFGPREAMVTLGLFCFGFFLVLLTERLASQESKHQDS